MLITFYFLQHTVKSVYIKDQFENFSYFWVFRISIHLIRIMIRIQHFRLNTDPDPDLIRIQGSNDQILKKFTQKKNIKFFCMKTYNLPIPRPPERTSKLQKKPSAFKREHPALFFFFCWSFLPSCIRILNPDSHPDKDPWTWLNPDPKRSSFLFSNSAFEQEKRSAIFAGGRASKASCSRVQTLRRPLSSCQVSFNSYT